MTMPPPSDPGLLAGGDLFDPADGFDGVVSGSPPSVSFWKDFETSLTPARIRPISCPQRVSQPGVAPRCFDMGCETLPV